MKRLPNRADYQGMGGHKQRLHRALALLVISVLVPVAFSSATSASTLLGPASDITSGLDHSCVLVGTDLYCWGNNTYGQLGNGTVTASSVPVLVSGGYSWASVSAGQYTTCAVTTTNAAYCWGYNTDGQVGKGSISSYESTPTAVLGGLTWRSISAGYESACGVTTTNVGYCWGRNYTGELGTNDNTQYYSPHLVSGGYTWSTISVGWRFACGATTGNVAYCWGFGGNGQLGNSGYSDSNNPSLVSGSHAFTTISSGGGNSCAVTTTNVAYCWGGNAVGQVGDNSTSSRPSPVAVSGGGAYAFVSVGFGGVTCGLLTSGGQKCWGYGLTGDLGNGGTSSSLVPVTVSGSLTASEVVAGGTGGCVLTTLQLVYCWGANADGEVGDGTTTDRTVPTGVIGLSALQGNVAVSATISAAFTFTVANKASACNGESDFSTSAGGASSISLGHITAGSNVSGGQALTVTGNSAHGFSVYIRGAQSSQNLRSAGHNWTDVAGSYSSPAVLGSGERFGYTYKDSTTSSSVTNPSSANFAALTSTNRAVMGSSSSLSGTGCVSFDAQTSSTTPADAYSATVIYLAIPSF